MVKSVQIILGFIYILSFTGKLLNGAEFFSYLFKLDIPNILFNPIYVTILTVELICGVFLLLGLYLRPIIIASFSLYGMFTFVLIYSFIKGTTAGCGCFGSIVPSSTGVISIIRNLILMSMFVLLFKRKKLCYTIIK